LNTQEQSPIVRRAWWRRRWLWIVVGAVIVVVVAASLIGALMTTGQHKQSGQTPHTLLVHMIGHVEDTAVVAGGTWTFEDKSPWIPGDTSGYIGQPCGDKDSGPQQYTVEIVSAGVADPVAAAAKVVRHWQGLGYKVRYVGPTDPANGNYTEIAADFPAGGGLGYTVSEAISSIDASSECSTDPGLSIKTK
jgi:hypothetical protein